MIVKIEDLHPGSSVFVKAKCDYCGAIKDVMFCKYLKSIKSEIHKYSCKNCVRQKVAESMQFKYGDDYTKKFANGARRLTYEHVKEAFEKEGYELVSTEYIDQKTKLQYKCPKHKNVIQQMDWDHFNRGHRCAFCAREKHADNWRTSWEDIEKEFTERGYKLLPNQEYKTNQDKLRFICDKHGEQIIRFDVFRRGTGCVECSREAQSENQRLDYDYVKKQFEDAGYELLSTEYLGSKQKLKYKCSVHGIRYVQYGNFQQGQRCTACTKRESKGEIRINEWLDSNNIIHSREFTFENLVSDKGAKLRYDFAVFNKDKSLSLLIEFDGEQHMRPIKVFGGEKRFKRQQKLDKLKTDYCINHSIKLIRIPYADFSILNQTLSREILGGESVGHS